MYGHILISTDGSELAQRGVDHGLSLAKALGARTTIVTATVPFPIPPAGGDGWVPSDSDRISYAKSQKTFADDLLARMKEAAEKLGVSAATVYLPDAVPAVAIVSTAESAGCDLIVMASHGRRGIRRLLLGSQTSEVLAHSPLPVLVVR